jgi:hypothetical protein
MDPGISLEYNVSAEQLITDRLLLQQVVAKQDTLDDFLRKHMEAEEIKFARVERYLMVLAGGMVMIASGYNLQEILQTLMSFMVG